MKRFLLISILFFLIASCSDEVETNSPSIQGQVDDGFFRTTNTTAKVNDNGSLTITGTSSERSVSLKTEAFEEGTYNLGQGSASEATFKAYDSTLYTTGSNGSGEITIDRIKEGAISGEVYFYAYSEGESDTLSFSKGSFFDVPLGSASAPEAPMSCDEANAERIAAEEAYNQADPEADNFTELCTAYQSALEAEIEACNDDNGELQGILDELSCGSDSQLSCSEAETAVNTAETAYNQADPNNEQQFQIVCQAYKEALQAKIDACGDEDGSTQEIIDGLNCSN